MPAQCIGFQVWHCVTCMISCILDHVTVDCKQDFLHTENQYSTQMSDPVLYPRVLYPMRYLEYIYLMASAA